MKTRIASQDLATPILRALLFIALLLSAATAFAQDPTVTAADPDMAEQESYGLVVKVSGSNFGTDSQVDFLVTGSETDTGGITVRNVKRRNPKTLEVTLDIAPDAQFEKKFDIRVRTNGRTGKGTELFRVLEKVTGGPDTTPPDDVLDLEVIDGPTLQPEGDYQVTLRWTSPADDSGQIDRAELKARPTESPLTLENWGDDMPRVLFRAGSWHDPTVPPGSIQAVQFRALAPETCYTVAARTADPTRNWSGLSNLVTVCTGLAPSATWQAERIDGCTSTAATGFYYFTAPELDFSLDHGPSLMYRKVCGDPSADGAYLARRGTAEWSAESLPLPDFVAYARDPVGGDPVFLYRQSSGKGPLVLWKWTGSSWEQEVIEADTKTGYVTHASAAFFHDVGAGTSRLALAYRMVAKGNRQMIRLALRNGSSWAKHDISPAGLGGDVQLAFDGLGRPGIAFLVASDGQSALDTRRFALWNSSAWLPVETITPQALWDCSGSSLAWNPQDGEFWATAACWEEGSPTAGWIRQVRACRRSSDPTPAWTCEEVETTGGYEAAALAFAEDGTAYVTTLVFSNWGDDPQAMLRLWKRATADPGSTWSMESVDWSVGFNGAGLRIDPTTQLPVLGYFAPLRPQPAWLFVWR